MESTRQDVRQRRRFMVRLGYTSAFTADVSGGGFSIRLLKVLPVNAGVEGSIHVEGQEIPFAGRVTWVKPGERHLGLPGQMGVNFTRISPDFPRLIDFATLLPTSSSAERPARLRRGS